MVSVRKKYNKTISDVERDMEIEHDTIVDISEYDFGLPTDVRLVTFIVGAIFAPLSIFILMVRLIYVSMHRHDDLY